MTTQCCATCKFWADYGSNEEPLRSIGACRRNPPIVIALDRNQPDDDEHSDSEDRFSFTGTTTWPEVQGVEWCGEHRPINGDDQRMTVRSFAEANINTSINIERGLSEAADRVKKELLEEIERLKKERGDQ